MNKMKKLAAIASAATCAIALPAYGQKYCSPSSSTTMLLVDHTTPYDDQDRQTVASGLETLLRNARPGDRLVVQTIGSEYASSKRVFADCVPGCSEGTTGVLGSCDAVRARGDRRAFNTQLVQKVKPLINEPHSAERSDILMTIASQTQEFPGKLARLVIFSDLIEHSPTYPKLTLLDQDPSTFVQAAAKLNAVPALQGTAVAVFGFGREDAPGRKSLSPTARNQLTALWTALFKAGGASSTTMKMQYEP